MNKEISDVKISNPLGYEKISKLLYQFSIPSIVGMTASALYNVVDRIFIGNHPSLGANGLAAITICFPAMIIMMSVGILFGQGGATLFSISLGKGDMKKADKILGNATTLMIAMSIIITLLGEIFLKDLLILFGATSEIIPFAEKYMRIIFLGTIFQVIGMGMNNFLRADGRPRLSMVAMFIGAGLNFILNPLFIFGFNWGMTGAALATVVSQLVSMIWSIYNFIKKDSTHRITFKNMKFDRKLSGEITLLGMPGFLLQLANSALNFVLNHLIISYGGSIAVSGMGIVNSLQTLLILPIIGINQGLQPIVSFNYGAKKFARVKKAAQLAIISATIIAIIGAIIINTIPNVLVSMFNRDPELMKFGTHALKTWMMCLPVVGFQIVGANFFQSIGMPKKAMLLTLSRQIIILIPSIIIFSKIWGMNGILHAAPFADFTAATVTSICFFSFIKKIDSINTPEI
ncbi:MATE family efflux transporter [Peptostreptococcus faecalis]|uniref:MATE family efflux transporter n=1 Tax=Peptostreptococcus faecalis TaxID=2045015 RepID=UPI001FA84DB8|nr:MATE family efflux transporter [Peptostreptococcus faecalis]